MNRTGPLALLQVELDDAKAKLAAAEAEVEKLKIENIKLNADVAELKSGGGIKPK